MLLLLLLEAQRLSVVVLEDVELKWKFYMYKLMKTIIKNKILNEIFCMLTFTL